MRGGVGAPGDRDDVAHVIAVTVRNENIIGLDLIDLDLFGQRITGDEGIEKEGLAASLHRETGVSVIGKLHGPTFRLIAERAMGRPTRLERRRARRYWKAMPESSDKAERLIDLSHCLEDGMITYQGLPGPIICDFLSREASRSRYAPGTEFQIGKIELVANTGTYLDSPFHRLAHGKDLSELELARLANLDCVVVRVMDRSARPSIRWRTG